MPFKGVTPNFNHSLGLLEFRIIKNVDFKNQKKNCKNPQKLLKVKKMKKNKNYESSSAAFWRSLSFLSLFVFNHY